MEKYTYRNDSTYVFPGFYSSILFNGDDLYEIRECEKMNVYYDLINSGKSKEEAEIESEKVPEYDIDDFNAFMNDVSEKVAEDLIAPLIEGPIFKNIEFHKVVSPTYYNFTTDKVEMKMDVDFDALKEWVLNDASVRNGFSKYLERNYTSCSGFISLVANDIEEYFKSDYENRDKADVLIDYYILTKIYDEYDVVNAYDECVEMTSYEYDMYDIAQSVLDEHLVQVEQEECQSEEQ